MRWLLFVIGVFVFGIVIGYYTPYPKECLQYFDGIKPVYNLNCILEEAQRQAYLHDR